MTITILNDNVEYPEIIFENPNGLNKGTYLAKPKEEILFQMPILKSKNGVIDNNNTKYIDLLVEDNEILTNLMEYLENSTKSQIKEKQGLWFSSKLLDDDINYYFIDSIKNNVLRVNVPENLYIFNKDHETLCCDDIVCKDIICIVEFNGLRFNTTSFKLDFNLKQVMVYESKFEKCVVRRESISNDLEENKECLDEVSNEEVSNEEVMNEEVRNEEDVDEESEEDSEDDDNLSEVIIDSLDENGEIIELKNPTDIYKKMYAETYERAKAAKQYAIKTFLEAKKIKQLHLLNDLESSDDEELIFN